MILHTNYDTMFENTIQKGVDYLEKYPNIKSLVIGLSGGVDSALTAAIGREICDQKPGCKLIGASIPIESNKELEIQNAALVGKAFCHEFTQVKFIDTLFKLFKLYIKVFHTSMYHSKKIEERIRYGNIKARLRMIYLYDKAHRNNGVVLSTDNLSELNLGFWTLHGDVGDLGFIQKIWKTEVYGMSRYLCERYEEGFTKADSSETLMYYADKYCALDAAIKAIPTDGLGVSNSDFDQLGVDSYEEADKILIEYIYGKNKEWENHPIIERYKNSDFKRINPYSIPRKAIISGPKPVNF